MSDGHVSTGTAAKALGVSLSTLTRWAHAGQVTPAFVTPGGHFRWSLDELRRQLRATGLASPGRSDEPEPQPVVAAIVTSRLGVLVTRRNDGRPPWGFVSGEIEPGESPADAAVREVKEETGLTVVPGRVIGRRVHPSTGRTMIYMSAGPVGSTAAHVGDRDELAEVRWLPLADAEQLMPGMFEPVRDYLARTLRKTA